MNIATAAKDLANYLNEFGTSDPDWYWTALQVTNADAFFDEEETNAADPSMSSDIFILDNGLRRLRVEYLPQHQRWEIN